MSSVNSGGINYSRELADVFKEYTEFANELKQERIKWYLLLAQNVLL